jgi:hypothetical protein
LPQDAVPKQESTRALNRSHPSSVFHNVEN